MGGGQLFEDEAAEQTRKHAHGQEEAGPAGHPSPAIERYPAARHDAVDMGVMGECRAPGVEHGGEADTGAEMLRVGGDGGERLGGGLEEDGVDGGLVVEGNVGDGGRQGEDHMKVG